MADTKKYNQTSRLLDIMRALRDPDTGCPWDLEQNFSTIAPYTIEEAYEVADAIERDDMSDLRSELGDLLLQVVFHSQIAEEAGQFSFEDVARSISDKMVSRHPHVFGDADQKTASEQTVSWETLKAEERQKRHDGKPSSALDDVALALPALMRSQKLQKRAARVGFDWPSSDDVLNKLEEEVQEVKEAILEGDQKHIEEELGDVLFVCVNLVRKLNAEAEDILKASNLKFTRRFQAMEKLATERRLEFDQLSLDEQEELWQEVKRREKTSSSAF